MCGIAGLYCRDNSRNRDESKSIAERMNDAMHVRGPDSHGLWQDPDSPLVLAHRRLAIIDLSADGHQPMQSASDRYVVSYNGEIYNYLEIQKELSALGVKFKGRSDTEVMLAAIDRWGLNAALQKLNGMFAIALWDRQTRELHLIRDRVGKKPLYFGWIGGENAKNRDFGFASELKALCAHPKFEKRINRQALNGYMRVAAVSAPHSIYEDVYMLPPGHRICINTETLDRKTDFLSLMQPYWSPKTAIQSARAGMINRPDEDIIDEFEGVLSTCVKDRMMSDVPLGAFLSGGIDSSSVVALMQAQSSTKIKTYTIGFKEAGFNEAEYAKDVAAHLQTDHHELYLSANDAMNIIPDLPQMYDEPLGDSSAIPTFLVSKFARQDVTVALSGDGGDEMLGGYNRHIQGPNIWNTMRFIPHPLRKLMTRTAQSVQTETWDKLRPSSPQFGRKIHKAAGIFALKDPEQVYHGLLTQWDNSDDVVLHSLTHHNHFDFPEGLSMAEKMMFADFTSYMHHSILTKVDRASMAVSLEARAPLLDKRVFNYAWSLPMHMKIRGGKGKYLLREVLARHIPRHLFERPKQGFAIPVGDWLRGPLKDWAQDLLDPTALKTDGIFDPAAIQTVWDAHLAGQGNHSERLWTLLMLQAWKKKWL